MPGTLEESRHLEKKVGFPKHLVLRCMICEESPASFVAECIDLDITVKAKTQQDARRSLESALTGYLRTVFEMGELSLLHRPSPISHRLRYQILRLRIAFMSSHDKFRLFDWSPANRPA